jgi:CheY-like chemotaxis protein
MSERSVDPGDRRPRRADAGSAAVTPGPAKVNVLVVDDSAEKRLALGAILEELDQNVVEARSGREALRELLKQDFAVVLLDVNMPGMDGFETAALIRQRQNSEHTPIIFITAYSDDTHARQGYSLGAVDYIITPVIPEVLKSKVAFFVDLYRKSDQIRRQAESLAERAAQLQRLTQRRSRSTRAIRRGDPRGSSRTPPARSSPADRAEIIPAATESWARRPRRRRTGSTPARRISSPRSWAATGVTSGRCASSGATPPRKRPRS